MKTVIFTALFFLSCFQLLGSMNEWYSIPQDLLEKAKTHSKADGVGSGWCGRGVYSVLKKIGYAKELKSRDGQDWEENLENAGWISFECEDPMDAPNGAVLVYLSDVRVIGRNKTGTKGGRFGHVEIVSEKNGKKVFVSDSVRDSPGGTVLHNFTKRAWVRGDVYLEGLGFAITDFQNELKDRLIAQSNFLNR